MNSIFFLPSPFNNDSSDNKRILSEVIPGLLGHQRLFTGWKPLDTTTMSSFFRCHESPGSTSVKICRRFFIFIKGFSLV